jgi:hypothetical protein
VETNNGNMFSNQGSEWRQKMEMCSATRDQSGEKQNMEMSEWKNENVLRLEIRVH